MLKKISAISLLMVINLIGMQNIPTLSQQNSSLQPNPIPEVEAPSLPEEIVSSSTTSTNISQINNSVESSIIVSTTNSTSTISSISLSKITSIIDQPTIRTGGLSLLLALTVPVTMLVLYRYQQSKSKRNILQTQESKIKVTK
jgi:hypothetical protein